MGKVCVGGEDNAFLHQTTQRMEWRTSCSQSKQFINRYIARCRVFVYIYMTEVYISMEIERMAWPVAWFVKFLAIKSAVRSDL